MPNQSLQQIVELIPTANHYTTFIALMEKLAIAVKADKMRPSQLADLFRQLNTDLDVYYEGENNMPGESCLTWAARSKDAVIIKALLIAGADPKMHNPILASVSNINAWNGDEIVEILQLLIPPGTDLKIINEDVNRAFLRAVGRGNAEAVEFLVKSGAKVNAINDYGQTALHILASNPTTPGVVEIIRLLLNSNAEINAKNNKSETPLHISMRHMSDLNSTIQANIVRTLLMRGADVTARDDTNVSILEIVARNDESGYRNLGKIVVTNFMATVDQVADDVIRVTNNLTADRTLSLSLTPAELDRFQNINTMQHKLLITRIREKVPSIDAKHAIQTLEKHRSLNFFEQVDLPDFSGALNLPNEVLQQIGSFLQFRDVDTARGNINKLIKNKLEKDKNSHATREGQRRNQSPSSSHQM